MNRAVALEVDFEDHCLRSVVAPAGVVAVAENEGAPTFVIDRLYDPSRNAPGTIAAKFEKGGMDATAIPLSIEEAVAGCKDSDALRALFEVAINAVQAGMALFLRAQQFDTARAMVTFAEEVAAAIDEALPPPPPDLSPGGDR